jgi:hypothetical protein
VPTNSSSTMNRPKAPSRQETSREEATLRETLKQFQADFETYKTNPEAYRAVLNRMLNNSEVEPTKIDEMDIELAKELHKEMLAMSEARLQNLSTFLDSGVFNLGKKARQKAYVTFIQDLHAKNLYQNPFRITGRKKYKKTTLYTELNTVFQQLAITFNNGRSAKIAAPQLSETMDAVRTDTETAMADITAPSLEMPPDSDTPLPEEDTTAPEVFAAISPDEAFEDFTDSDTFLPQRNTAPALAMPIAFVIRGLALDTDTSQEGFQPLPHTDTSQECYPVEHNLNLLNAPLEHLAAARAKWEALTEDEKTAEKTARARARAKAEAAAAEAAAAAQQAALKAQIHALEKTVTGTQAELAKMSGFGGFFRRLVNWGEKERLEADLLELTGNLNKLKSQVTETPPAPLPKPQPSQPERSRNPLERFRQNFGARAMSAVAGAAVALGAVALSTASMKTNPTSPEASAPNITQVAVKAPAPAPAAAQTIPTAEAATPAPTDTIPKTQFSPTPGDTIWDAAKDAGLTGKMLAETTSAIALQAGISIPNGQLSDPKALTKVLGQMNTWGGYTKVLESAKGQTTIAGFLNAVEQAHGEKVADLVEANIASTFDPMDAPFAPSMIKAALDAQAS